MPVGKGHFGQRDSRSKGIDIAKAPHMSCSATRLSRDCGQKRVRRPAGQVESRPFWTNKVDDWAIRKAFNQGCERGVRF